jgi:hypothetical protein
VAVIVDVKPRLGSCSGTGVKLADIGDGIASGGGFQPDLDGWGRLKTGTDVGFG